MRVTLEINPMHLPQSIKTPNRARGAFRANTKEMQPITEVWKPLCQLQRQMFWLDFNRCIHYLCSYARRGKDGANPAQQAHTHREPCSTQAHSEGTACKPPPSPELPLPVSPGRSDAVFSTMCTGFSGFFSPRWCIVHCFPGIFLLWITLSREAGSCCSLPPSCTVLQRTPSPRCSQQRAVTALTPC